MSNLTRHIKRRLAKKVGKKWEGKPQPTILLPDGGYRTLHPTKGWMKVSGKRIKI